MSVFGSRDEDPLLQDDPLAPSADDDDHEEASPDETTSSDDVTRSASSSSAEGGRGGGTVFGRVTPTGTNDEEDGRETRVLVQSPAEAASGALAALNNALDNGWRIRRVDIEEDASAGRDAEIEGPSTEPLLTLAFVLHRSESG
jgi:hypothetical protein